MEIGKEEKNYIRILLKDIADKKLEKPIVLTGVYQYDTRYEYATFTNIRILLNPPYSKTKIICDHLNILKKDIINHYSLCDVVNKKKFYFVGYPVEYKTNGDKRYGFKLSEDVSFSPFGLLSGRHLYEEGIRDECADLLDWVSNNITDGNLGLLRKHIR